MAKIDMGQAKLKPMSKPKRISPPPIHFPLDTKNCNKKKLPPIIPEISKFTKLNPRNKFKINIIMQAGKVMISKIK